MLKMTCNSGYHFPSKINASRMLDPRVLQFCIDLICPVSLESLSEILLLGNMLATMEGIEKEKPLLVE